MTLLIQAYIILVLHDIRVFQIIKYEQSGILQLFGKGKRLRIFQLRITLSLILSILIGSPKWFDQSESLLMSVAIISSEIFFIEFFVDVEGTKDVKQMITLLAITSQFIPQNRRGSERLRKQMVINKHEVNRCKQM